MKLGTIFLICLLMFIYLMGCTSDGDMPNGDNHDASGVNDIADDMTGEPTEDPDFPDGSSQPFEEITLPDIFPLYPGAELFTAFEKDGVNTIEYHSQDSVEDICDFYINELATEGFDITSSNCNSEEAVIETSKNNYAFSLQVTDYSGITEIIVIF